MASKSGRPTPPGHRERLTLLALSGQAEGALLDGPDQRPKLADQGPDAPAVMVAGFKVDVLAPGRAETAEREALLLDRGDDSVGAHRGPIMTWNTARVSRGNA